MVAAKKWVITEPSVDRTLREGGVKLVEETLQELADNEVLFEAVYISVDPYIGHHANFSMVGETVGSQQVARVTQSRNSKFPVGMTYLCNFGWRTHTILNPEMSHDLVSSMPTGLGDLPPSYSLGILGIAGVTAYVGLMTIGVVKPGETVLVSDAAGSVGSLVGQLARIMGCNVIGCGTTEAQSNWLKQIGYSHTITRQTDNMDAKMKAADPSGVDVYFDQVGGEFSVNIIKNHMKTEGRVVIAGSRSLHDVNEPSMGPCIFHDILRKQLTMKGFVVDAASEYWEEALFNISQWLNMGKFVYKEHTVEGFENLFAAACEGCSSTSLGTSILKV